MAKVIVQHDVADFNAWKPGFDSHEAARAANGITNSKVYQDAENPNKVTLISDVESIDKVKDFFGNPELQAAMKNSGVTSQPSISFLQEA